MQALACPSNCHSCPAMRTTTKTDLHYAEEGPGFWARPFRKDEDEDAEGGFAKAREDDDAVADQNEKRGRHWLMIGAGLGMVLLTGGGVGYYWKGGEDSESLDQDTGSPSSSASVSRPSNAMERKGASSLWRLCPSRQPADRTRTGRGSNITRAKARGRAVRKKALQRLERKGRGYHRRQAGALLSRKSHLCRGRKANPHPRLLIVYQSRRQRQPCRWRLLPS
ncbi:MAG: hypothetical protein FD153_1421 [Rhodospirillaceae bacterium]|nr:MAG: hypothetical protein FD153_1421 [Rhodospirillaceae bacterium]